MATYADGDIDASTPDDSALLGQGDDRIREFKRQVRDRLSSVFVDSDADPLVLMDGAVSASSLADGSVITAKLADKAVTTAKLGDTAVDTAQLADSAITEAKLGASAVTTDKIDAEAVTDAKIAGMNGAKLTNGTVDTVQLADNSVTSAKIAADAVGSSEIADGSVGTNELADDSVTTAKLADESVTADKLSGLDFLEQRHADYTLSATAVSTRSTDTQTKISFPGIVAGDPVIVSPPTVFGDVSDASQIKLLAVWVIAYTDQVQLVISNPNDGPLTLPAGVYRVYCTKPASDW